MKASPLESSHLLNKNALIFKGQPMSSLNAIAFLSNISRILVGNDNADHSDVVGALPVGASPTTFSLSI